MSGIWNTRALYTQIPLPAGKHKGEDAQAYEDNVRASENLLNQNFLTIQQQTGEIISNSNALWAQAGTMETSMSTLRTSISAWQANTNAMVQNLQDAVVALNDAVVYLEKWVQQHG